jgi:phosphatidylserine/phosphatidylglycerophosphate/cardiolipin synthase-like enzyme/uncharacterized membrane protein YdjX (TVP38/TMEM64 family)
MPEENCSVLIEGETCWRLAKAGRVKVLIDGAAYFQALRAALLKAEHSVFIVGWDIDSRTRLVGDSGEPEDGYAAELRVLLMQLIDRRPDLKIHLLLWDYSVLYALERELLPAVNLDWTTPPQVSVCLDDVLPMGASHHQKIVVIDDAVAFSGGFDLTIRRWDTSAHDLENPKRVDPNGDPYRPFHDIQMLVDGDAARALGELVRNRWADAACETPIEITRDYDPWPDDLQPDFADVKVGISRTLAAHDGDPVVREVEASYRKAIEAAQKTIYIENQFLTAESLAECLARRMRENVDLEVLTVGPNVHQSWLEENSMNAGRRRFVRIIEEAGVQDRFRLLYPALPGDDGDQGVMVHAKFMIVDDRVLKVGSANLNNRSMGVDSECDLSLEVSEARHRKAVRAIRDRLLAEHLGTDAARVEAAIESEGSLLAAVSKLSAGERSLKPIDLSDAPDNDVARAVGKIADPERPIETPNFPGDMFGGQPRKRPFARIAKLVLVVGACLCLMAVWRFTPLAGLVEPATFLLLLQGLVSDTWMPALMVAIFVVGGILMFPVTVLIVVTGMAFEPLTAFAIALCGSLLSASVTYYLGYAMGRTSLRNIMGKRTNRIRRAMARRGVLSVATLRMAPVAPFTLINIVAGASRIRFLDYFMGTLAGMLPGILVVALLGHQIGEFLRDPELTQMLLLGGGLVAWLAFSVALQAAATKLRTGRDD